MSAPHPDFPDEYYHDADLRLVQAMPADALEVLDVGCGAGRLGEVLKHLVPARRVVGIAACRDDAAQAAIRLDAVHTLDLMADTLPFPAQTFDAIVLRWSERIGDPQTVLTRLRPLLRAGGTLLTAFSNPQHWSRLDALLRGEGPTDHGHAATAPGLTRLLLDAGYLPRIADRRLVPPPADWLGAMQSATARQGLPPAAFAARTTAWEYFVAACPIDDLPTDSGAPITVGACTNDPVVLRENLFASPCLQDGRHETLTVQGATSAADGLNAIIAQARHELVVLAHQDVYLPGWWVSRLWQQVEHLRRSGGPLGVLGVYGVLGTTEGVVRSGRVCDRDALLDEVTPLPARVGSLDELVLIVPRDTPLRFDPALGYHLYGTDICLAAEALQLPSRVIDAPCFHNSRQSGTLPAAFADSKAILRTKWPARLPIATPCDVVGA